MGSVQTALLLQISLQSSSFSPFTADCRELQAEAPHQKGLRFLLPGQIWTPESWSLKPVHHPQERVSAVVIPTSALRELTGSLGGSREKEGCRGREEEGGAACAPPPSGPAGGAARRQRRRRAHGAAASPAPLRLRPGFARDSSVLSRPRCAPAG